MKKVLVGLVISVLLVSCAGPNSPHSSDTVTATPTTNPATNATSPIITNPKPVANHVGGGQIGVQQLVIPNASTVKAVVPINAGDINGSTTQYVIFRNLGTQPVTNVQLVVIVPTASNSLDLTDDSIGGPFFSHDSNGVVVGANLTDFTVASFVQTNPTSIPAIQPDSLQGVFQLVGINLLNGTVLGGHVTASAVATPGLQNAYVVVWGDTVDNNGVTFQTPLVVKLSMLMRVECLVYTYELAGDSSKYLAQWQALLNPYNSSMIPNKIALTFPRRALNLGITNNGTIAVGLMMGDLGFRINSVVSLASYSGLSNTIQPGATWVISPSSDQVWTDVASGLTEWNTYNTIPTSYATNFPGIPLAIEGGTMISTYDAPSASMSELIYFSNATDGLPVGGMVSSVYNQLYNSQQPPFLNSSRFGIDSSNYAILEADPGTWTDIPLSGFTYK